MSIFDDVGRAVSGKGKGNPIGYVKKAVEGGVREVRHVAEDGVKQIQSETKHGLEQIKNELPDIPKEIEKALERALQEFAKVLAGPLLKQYAKLLEVATPDTVWLSIGPFTFTVSEVPKKLNTLKSYAENPPAGKTRIRQFVTDLEPDDVEIALRVNVPGTQSLTAGATLVYLKDNFEQKFDTILSTLSV